jgi:hypothetical protein
MDVSRVYRILPNPITITLGPRNPTTADVTVNECRKRPLNKREVQLLGGTLGVETDYRTFLLPVVETGTTIPHRGDVITDPEGYIWQIMSIDLELEDCIRRCVCYKQPAQVEQ